MKRSTPWFICMGVILLASAFFVPYMLKEHGSTLSRSLAGQGDTAFPERAWFIRMREIKAVSLAYWQKQAGQKDPVKEQQVQDNIFMYATCVRVADSMLEAHSKPIGR